MAEINNLHQNDPEEMENLENLSPQELQERINEEKKNARRSLRLAFTALLAIVAVCIAWFASNNQVTVEDIQITVRDEEPFDIASIGDRQTAEKNFLIDDNDNKILSEGTERHFDNYIDIDSKETVEAVEAGGKLEFYIIPKQTGLTSVTISLNMEGYKLNETTGKAQKLDNPKIQNLLNGHILLFRHLDDKVNVDNIEDGGIEHFYSNYKVTLKAEILEGDNSSVGAEDDNIIYTLAKIKPEFIEPTSTN